MPFGALALVLLSAFLHAAWNAAAKGSGAPAAFVFLADLAALVALTPLFLFFRLGDLTSEVWLMVLLTGVIHGVYAWSLTRAYESGDLTLVYPISRSTPAFVPFLAVPFLGERLTVAGGVGIALVMGGVWLVSLGSSGTARTPPSGSADPGAASGAAPVVKRLLTPELRFAYLTLAATVAYSLVDKRAMALLDSNPWSGPAPRAAAYYALLCVSYLPFLYLFSRRRLDGALQALRTAPVSYVVATRQLSVVFAVGLALLWLRERPSRSRLLGAALTVLGVAIIGLLGG
jgi:uncharacterized membrane protein